MKQKTITVKPFLNKNLNSIEDETGKIAFPLYYQITFERKNTQLKSYYNKYVSSLSLGDKELQRMIEFEKAVLEKIVRKEKLSKGADFQLTGLKATYEVYIKSVDEIFQSYLKKKLIRNISFTYSEFQNVLKFDGFETHFLVLYKAAKKLIDNLNKYCDADFKDEVEAYKCFNKAVPFKDMFGINHVTLIDWINKDSDEHVVRKMNEVLEGNETEFKKHFKTLNNIIIDRLKYL
ncbi:MAG: hypothetical protein SFY32_07080 [Bacteroidota bacterium]|nr:hypothetical protein [Bacteroidota bacterium]